MGQVHPAKSPLLKAICLWWKARYVLSFLLSFPFLFLSFYFSSFHPLSSFLFLSSSSDGRMGKHIANARLNLSQVTTGFPLSQERSAKEVVVAWVSRKPPGSAKDHYRLSMYFFGHFFFSKFCCFWYFAKVSQAHAGLKRSLLGCILKQIIANMGWGLPKLWLAMTAIGDLGFSKIWWQRTS